MSRQQKLINLPYYYELRNLVAPFSDKDIRIIQWSDVRPSVCLSRLFSIFNKARGA